MNREEKSRSIQPAISWFLEKSLNPQTSWDIVVLVRRIARENPIMPCEKKSPVLFGGSRLDGIYSIFQDENACNLYQYKTKLKQYLSETDPFPLSEFISIIKEEFSLINKNPRRECSHSGCLFQNFTPVNPLPCPFELWPHRVINPNLFYPDEEGQLLKNLWEVCETSSPENCISKFKKILRKFPNSDLSKLCSDYLTTEHTSKNEVYHRFVAERCLFWVFFRMKKYIFPN